MLVGRPDSIRRPVSLAWCRWKVWLWWLTDSWRRGTEVSHSCRQEPAKNKSKDTWGSNLCLTDTIEDECKQVCFQQTHDQAFASGVFDGVLGPLVRHTWPYVLVVPLYSSGSNAPRESRALNGRRVSSKSPFVVLICQCHSSIFWSWAVLSICISKVLPALRM